MIRENILRAKERIYAACSRADRKPGSISIVAVSKGRALKEIEEAVAAGITDIGENRVQEALGKYNDMQYAPSVMRPRWHMVGRLQTNKAKEAVRVFDLIHSVDSLHIAVEINKQAAKINKIQDVLIEIKTSPEAAKFGLKPDEAGEVIKKISGLKNISVKGLMTIAPMVSDPENARPYFRMLRELRDKICGEWEMENGLRVLSMGMSDDFEVAIEEGSNMVRLGRAIFESADYTD